MRFRNKIPRLLIPFILSEVIKLTTASHQTIPRYKYADFNTSYSDTVNSTTQWEFFYKLKALQEKLPSTNIRLKVSTIGSAGNSVSVTILQPNSRSTSIQLPLANKKSLMTGAPVNAEINYNAERTICILDEQANNSISFSVRISTGSKLNVTFILVVAITEDFLLELDMPRQIVVSPSTPQYFHFKYTPNMEGLSSVRILADINSTEKACLTLSVQTATCPIFDTVETIHYDGIFQSVTTAGALIIRRQKPLQTDFIIVVIAHSNNTDCKHRDPYSFPYERTLSARYLGTAWTTSVNLSVISDEERFPDRGKRTLMWLAPIMLVVLVAVISSILICLIRWNCYVCGEGMREANRVGLANPRKRNSFCLFVTITGIFYIIPAVQFPIFQYGVAIATGDSDMCYLNYRCAMGIDHFLDLNHLVSNVAYILFGFICLGQVRIHRVWRDKAILEHIARLQLNVRPGEENNIVDTFGVRPNFDLLNAIGVSLIMTGVLSLAYHMCPNEATFQFDTSFMYVIAMLIMLYVYQLRHQPLLTQYHAFGVLAVIGVLSVMTIVVDDLYPSMPRFWLAFGFVLLQHFFTGWMIWSHSCIGSSSDADRIVADGNVEDGNVEVENVADGNVEDGNVEVENVADGNVEDGNVEVENVADGNVADGILAAVSVTIGLILSIFWCIKKWHFCTYLLYLMVGNALWHMTYYISMKVCYREFTWKSFWFPMGLFAFAAVSGGFALKFYMDTVTDWDESAAGSRTFNKECLNIIGLGRYPYDTHDAWHFLSALTIFLMFNGLLVLDDDLILDPRIGMHIF